MRSADGLGWDGPLRGLSSMRCPSRPPHRVAQDEGLACRSGRARGNEPLQKQQHETSQGKGERAAIVIMRGQQPAGNTDILVV